MKCLCKFSLVSIKIYNNLSLIIKQKFKINKKNKIMKTINNRKIFKYV